MTIPTYRSQISLPRKIAGEFFGLSIALREDLRKNRFVFHIQNIRTLCLATTERQYRHEGRQYR